MLKIAVFLPFVLMAMGLIWVMVFQPRNKKIRQATTTLTQQEFRFPKKIFAFLVLLLIIPLIAMSFLDGMWAMIAAAYYSLYYVLVFGLIGVVLLWYLAGTLFAAGVPLAQDIGKGMTEEQRRATWRRARRAFDQFRAS